jgi:hypothetical protein
VVVGVPPPTTGPAQALLRFGRPAIATATGRAMRPAAPNPRNRRLDVVRRAELDIQTSTPTPLFICEVDDPGQSRPEQYLSVTRRLPFWNPSEDICGRLARLKLSAATPVPAQTVPARREAHQSSQSRSRYHPMSAESAGWRSDQKGSGWMRETGNPIASGGAPVRWSATSLPIRLASATPRPL